ncbi:ATP-binding protein [Nostoc sp. UIC 10607]|uniref:ATP/GTP-binding protein n=1 Tax=Nostoc sp. UIC 10607 TaxID=3045935 RepID=UPI0039A18F3A
MIAIEGTHCTGKSTLALALTAYYKSHHIHTASFVEPARQSPFLEEILIHKKGKFDIFTELHLFAAQLTEELITARNHELIICDRSLVSVLGYARLLLTADPNSFESSMLNAMKSLCQTYSHIYDAVFYLSDMYDLQRTKDPFRGFIMQEQVFQREIDLAIKEAYDAVGLKRVEVPTGMSLSDKVQWVVEQVGASIVKQTPELK